MVKHCCVERCSTVWNPYANISLFSFPWNNDPLLQKWNKVVPTKCKISKNSRICSLHFESEFVEQKFGKRILKKDVIPTIFINDIGTLQSQNNVLISEPVGQVREILQCQGIQSPDGTMENEIAKKHVSLLTKQMKSVGTHVSPNRLKPTAREEELQRTIKLLQGKMRRRDKKVLAMSQLLEKLKESNTSSDGLE